VNAPKLYAGGIGGNQAIAFNNGQSGNAFFNYLKSNTLAARFTFGQVWTVGLRFRFLQDSVRDHQLFAAGNSASGAANFFQVTQNRNTGGIQIVTNSAGGGTITRNSVGIDLQYDQHTMLLVSNGVSLILYIDGAVVPLDNALLDVNPIVADRFAMFTFLANAEIATSTGYLQYFVMASAAISAGNAAVLNAQWLAPDFTRQRAVSPQFAWTGDSITEGNAGSGLGGFRPAIEQWVIDNGLSINNVGFIDFGLMPNRTCFAQGGNNLATISANFVANLGTKVPRLVWLLGGTNDQTIPTTPQALASYTASLNTMSGAAPASMFIVSQIPPFQPGTVPADTNQPVFNAGLPAIWNTYDAANPARTLVRFNIANAVNGGVWSGTYFADNTHYNDLGNSTAAAAMILGLGLNLRAISPTLNALTAKQTVPAPAANLPNAVPVVLTAVVTRTPSTVQFFRDSAVLISAGAATGNGKIFTFSWTPGAIIGPHTVYAVVTDTLSGESATSPIVNVTVS
jgi:hypothetical protein